jgi:hypothetical protein
MVFIAQFSRQDDLSIENSIASRESSRTSRVPPLRTSTRRHDSFPTCLSNPDLPSEQSVDSHLVGDDHPTNLHSSPHPDDSLQPQSTRQREDDDGDISRLVFSAPSNPDKFVELFPAILFLFGPRSPIARTTKTLPSMSPSPVTTERLLGFPPTLSSDHLAL